MFGPEDLKRLVKCAGQALRDEDGYLTQCADANDGRTVG
jgi:hypothetical protein